MNAESLEIRIAVLEERSRSDAAALEVRKETVEKRLTDLNGEAGRLKTILDASVPKSTFDAYVSTQRDKDDAREHTQREHFDAYEKSQAAAFKIYSDEMAKWRSSINVRIAGWAGGLAVLLAALQFWMKYSGK